MKNKKVLTFFLLLLIPSIVAHAYWVWSPEDGKFVNPDEAKHDEAYEEFEYAMRIYRDRNIDGAIKAFEDLLKRHRGSKVAPDAQYRLGTLFEEKGDYLKAFEAYKVILESYPQSERTDEVIEREFRIGNLFLSGRKAKLMGLEILPSLPRAADVFQHIVNNAPYSEYGDQAQFRLGITFKRWGHFQEAIDAFQAVIDNYPQSELVADARYQVAESAYLRSNAAGRDQRALENASDLVDGFLARHPETTASEKASKLRQEIDEKNAQKNYNIGAYYEKTKYLSSAIIYYKDVAERYPHTKWGEKSIEKLKTLERPVEYINEQEKELNEKIEAARNQLDARKDSLSDEDKDSLKRTLERLEKKKQLLSDRKSESMHSREEDLSRREKELETKIKNLQKKKIAMGDNQSEDFKKAMTRWESSLEKEREDLLQERSQLKEWKETLGMDTDGGLWDVLPFVGDDPEALEQVRRVEAKKLFKVSDEKKELLEEKELLYKQLQEVKTLLHEQRGDRTDIEEEQASFAGAVTAGTEALEQRKRQLSALSAEIKDLEGKIEMKSKVYKEKFGESKWKSLFSAPSRVVSSSADVVSKSLDVLNPFTGNRSDLEKASTEELLELRMHLNEKIAAQKTMVDLLGQAFNEALAAQEQQKLMRSLRESEDADPRELRKQIKAVEKEIRVAYEEIGDRHQRIKDLGKELDSVLSSRQGEKNLVSRVAGTALTPVRLTLNASQDFLFGRKSDEARLTETAEHVQGDSEFARKARTLKDEIQLESLLIESRNREIYQLRKELDILKTKASLAGGYKFRSSMVSVPYDFLEEALDTARDLIPGKEQKDAVMDRLNEETKELEANREKLSSVEAEIASRGKDSSEKAVAMPSPINDDDAEKGTSSEEWVEEALLREELETLQRELKSAKTRYEKTEAAIGSESKAIEREMKEEAAESAWGDHVKDLSKKEQKLMREYRELGAELADLIKNEAKLEKEEAGILEQRINKIDQLIQQVASKSVAQDLLNERSRLEQRLTNIESRLSFLTREQERFQLSNAKVTS